MINHVNWIAFSVNLLQIYLFSYNIIFILPSNFSSKINKTIIGSYERKETFDRISNSLSTKCPEGCSLDFVCSSGYEWPVSSCSEPNHSI